MSNEKKGLVPKLRFPEFKESGEWTQKKLGDKDVSDFVTRRIDLNKLELSTYVSTENILQDFGGVKTAAKLPSSGSFTKYIEGDVLISNIRPYLRKVWLADRSGAASNDVVVVRPNRLKDSDNALVPFIIKSESFIDYVMKGAKGVKMPRGDISLMKEYPVALPDSKEQQKIADCLSSVDALISAQADKVDALKTHKKGLMQRLFPREGETVPRMRFADFQDEDDWKEYTIEEVAGFRRGSFPQPYGLPEWYDDENGFPFVQVFDVSDDMKLKPYTKRKISALAAQQSVFIKKGTLIITIQGSIGRVAVTQYDAYIDRTLLIFQKFKKPVEKLFFAYVIQMLFEIERHKAPGGIIKTITKEALSSFIVKLPSKDEQQKIADCLSSLDELIAAEADKLDALKTHKKGLMQQLFPVLDEAAV